MQTEVREAYGEARPGWRRQLCTTRYTRVVPASPSLFVPSAVTLPPTPPEKAAGTRTDFPRQQRSVGRKGKATEAQIPMMNKMISSIFTFEFYAKVIWRGRERVIFINFVKKGERRKKKEERGGERSSDIS